MDGRRARGDKTRAQVAAEAAALASLHGLEGMTLAKLAERLGSSKSSVQIAFHTKQELQLAAINAATGIFAEAVILPAQRATKGKARLLALIEKWLDYVKQRRLPGGCFMAATLSECDSHPGPVRDALIAMRQDWIGLLERQICIAQSAGDIPPEPEARLLAFEIDAILASANVTRNLTDEDQALDWARKLIRVRVSNID